MLSMRILYNRQRSCSTSCQLTLQQLACWLLRSQPLLLVPRFAFYSRFTCAVLDYLMLLNRFKSMMMACLYSRFTCVVQIINLLCYSIGSNHWWWHALSSFCCCLQWSVLDRSWFYCTNGYANYAWFMEQECWRREAHGVGSFSFAPSFILLFSLCMPSPFCQKTIHWPFFICFLHDWYSSELVQRVAINEIAESIMAFNTNYKETGLFGVYAVAKVSLVFYLF
jgi:hypothetical protein